MGNLGKLGSVNRLVQKLRQEFPFSSLVQVVPFVFNFSSFPSHRLKPLENLFDFSYFWAPIPRPHTGLSNNKTREDFYFMIVIYWKVLVQFVNILIVWSPAQTEFSSWIHKLLKLFQIKYMNYLIAQYNLKKQTYVVQKEIALILYKGTNNKGIPRKPVGKERVGEGG